MATPEKNLVYNRTKTSLRGDFMRALQFLAVLLIISYIQYIKSIQSGFMIIPYAAFITYTIYIVKKFRAEQIVISGSTLQYTSGKKKFTLSAKSNNKLWLENEQKKTVLFVEEKPAAGDLSMTKGAIINVYKFEKSEQIIDWVKANLTLEVETDEENESPESIEILSTNKFGTNKEERSAYLQKWQRMIKTAEIVGGLFFFGLHFFPEHLEIFDFLAMGFVILILFTPRISKGLVKIRANDRLTAPTPIFSFIGPALAIITNGIRNNNIADYQNFVIAAAVFGCLFFLSILMYFDKSEIRTGRIVYLIFIGVLLGSMSVCFLNPLQYNTPDKIQKAVVLSKERAKKDAIFFLILQTKPQLFHDGEFVVNRAVYKKYQKGDSVEINHYKGNLDILYYKVQ